MAARMAELRAAVSQTFHVQILDVDVNTDVRI